MTDHMAVESMMLGKIMSELLIRGVQIPWEVQKRNGGAGPAEGCTLLIGDKPANVPVNSSYARNSSYSLQKKSSGLTLYKDSIPLFPVEIVGRPDYYNHMTDDGIAYHKIALLHGKDCLATTVFQRCIYWNSKKRCRFCGIELSLQSGKTIEVKTPAQLKEVAETAKGRDGIQHVVLTTGCTSSLEKAIGHIADCVSSIKESTGLPVHVQIEPPSDPGMLDELKRAGLDTLGIHIESFDENVLSKIAPAKYEYGLPRYTKSWEKAVALFGKNQVSSFLIAGLGESPDSMVSGAEYLAELGVFPFVVPFRPIPGICCDVGPTEPAYMDELYRRISDILQQYGLSSKVSKAGCVRCGACSALAYFESDG